MNRHSRGLQSIVFTLSQSVPELGLLIMILIISGLIFASLTYYIEMVNNCHMCDNHKHFQENSHSICFCQSYVSLQL